MPRKDFSFLLFSYTLSQSDHDSKEKKMVELSFFERLDVDLSLLLKGIQNKVVFTVMKFMLWYMNRFLRQIQPVYIYTCIFKKLQINAEVVFMVS